MENFGLKSRSFGFSFFLPPGRLSREGEELSSSEGATAPLCPVFPVNGPFPFSRGRERDGRHCASAGGVASPRLAAQPDVTQCAAGRAGALGAAWLRLAARSGARRALPPRSGGMAEPGPALSGAGEVQPAPGDKEEAAPAPKKRRLAAGERYVPPPRKLSTGVSFGPEHFAETSYYFEGGLRKVRPYYFDFRTYCKGRWVGRSLLDVFSTEFRAQPLAYYRAAARAGRLRLNEEPVRDLDIVLKVGTPRWVLLGMAWEWAWWGTPLTQRGGME